MTSTARRDGVPAGAVPGFQIYMTPQDDRTADVLSNALGRSTVTAVTKGQSRIRALEDSANVSRRSEDGR